MTDELEQLENLLADGHGFIVPRLVFGSEISGSVIDHGNQLLADYRDLVLEQMRSANNPADQAEAMLKIDALLEPIVLAMGDLITAFGHDTLRTAPVGKHVLSLHWINTGRLSRADVARSGTLYEGFPTLSAGALALVSGKTHEAAGALSSLLRLAKPMALVEVVDALQHPNFEGGRWSVEISAPRELGKRVIYPVLVPQATDVISVAARDLVSAKQNFDQAWIWTYHEEGMLAWLELAEALKTHWWVLQQIALEHKLVTHLQALTDLLATCKTTSATSGRTETTIPDTFEFNSCTTTLFAILDRIATAEHEVLMLGYLEDFRDTGRDDFGEPIGEDE